MKALVFSVFVFGLTWAFAKQEMVAEDPETRASWAPICSDAKVEHWMQSYTACRDEFNKVIQGSGKKKELAVNMCRCVADGLVQKTTCSILKKLKSDVIFRKDFVQKLGNFCHVHGSDKSAPSL